MPVSIATTACRIAAVLSGSLLSLGAALAEPSALSEEQYVDLVLAQSLETRITEGEVALARAGALDAGRWPNPSIEWERESGGTPATGGRQDILIASIPLVLSGRLGLERSAAEKGTLAAEARAARARAELRRDAIRAFSAVLAAEGRRATLGRSLEALTALSEAAGARERAGAAAGYHRLRIEVERASIEGQLLAAASSARRAASDALGLLGPSATMLPVLKGSLSKDRPLPALPSLLADLESRRGDVRALSLEAEGADAARRAAARGWIPDPTVNAGVQLIGARDGLDTGYVVGLSVPLPLFQRGQGEEARSAASRSLAQTRRSQLVHAASVRLAALLEDVGARREQLARHRSEVLARTDELRQIANAAYRGGEADLLVLVDAERAWREAQLTAIDLDLGLVETESDLLLLSGAFDGATTGSIQ